MTTEEITRILQTVAENQAKHDEMHSLHSADIAEIDRMLEASLQSQNRYDERLALTSEIMHTLADKQLKNEEILVELAAARDRHEVRMGQLEASYELFEGFVRDFRNETDDHFVETDKRMAEFIGETNGRFAETDRLFAETDKKLTALASAQAKTDQQINGLIAAQARTDEQIRFLLDRNGPTVKPKAKAKKASTKKATKAMSRKR